MDSNDDGAANDVQEDADDDQGAAPVNLSDTADAGYLLDD